MGRFIDLLKRCFRLILLCVFDAFYRMFDFSGRTSRTPYLIATSIFGLCAAFLLALSIWSKNWELGDFQSAIRPTFKSSCYFFLFLLTSLFVRRNHDFGASIWDIFNPFNIRNHSLVGDTVFDLGDPKPNKYGQPHSLW